ncbi:SDR family oxidoreductase [Sandaracinus amylolyticus]|uniref:SDR family oxidoreductase n=1 Tax=Sandaracinus amylolyticus TaxID=927083 RepID=UPI001F407554|nr:SDR family oxidoreductase [Sandaracinus amylolyticus]UJR79492.1 WW domain-containing oxidoreductase [Sandaracinus amylolyticus]
MSLYGMFAGKGPSGFGYGSSAEDVTEGISLAGKTILVTGCNSGLGLETMRVLAKRGAHVIGTARTAEKAREAGKSVQGETSGFACELSDPRSVRACVDAVKATGRKLDAIIANAGIMALPKREVAHGIELQLFTNHFGHFMLVTGLLDALADDGRVVIVSSDAHRNAPKETIRFDDLGAEKSYSPWTAYGQSKIANILFAKELARRFAASGSKRTANALHPGVIRTNLSRHMNPVTALALAVAGPIALKSVGEGAATECFLATHPSLAGVSGEYFADCNVAKPRADARDPEIAKKLWARTEEIVAALPR